MLLTAHSAKFEVYVGDGICVNCEFPEKHDIFSNFRRISKNGLNIMKKHLGEPQSVCHSNNKKITTVPYARDTGSGKVGGPPGAFTLASAHTPE